ncbi:CD3337/EF1877 family mobilome membrane protein [Staphylospora marina]|uniref:CD3337/EF1877 family mobilome membrane protein n=1 Tax=Staphylospora marina TaxID=2490858 RepID=UPI000F5BB080|nr:type IV secretion system protein [Staphylospora marina]
MNWKKWCFALLACLLMFLGPVGGSGRAEAEETTKKSEGYGLITDLLTVFPEEQAKRARAHGYEVKFNRYKPSQYNLELTLEERSFWEVNDVMSDVSYDFMNKVNNFLWQGLLAWDFTVILLTENAFSLDVVDQFSEAVEIGVQQLAGFDGDGIGNTGLFGHFLTTMIIVVGAWIAYKGIVQKKTTDALSALVVSAFILMAGLAFFANAGGIMRYLNDISSGLSQEVVGVGVSFQGKMEPDAPVYPSDVASLVVADKMYHMMVYEPYIMLQHGKTSSDPEMTRERVERILAQKPGSEARAEAVKAEKSRGNMMVTTSGVFQRLTLILILIVSHLILGVMFLILAGAMLVYQFLFVLIALFAPFAFLLALNPSWRDIVVTWAKKLIGYQVIKLMIGILLSMLLVLSQMLYTMTPPEKVGYVWTIAMQLILVVGVIWKRNELFGILQAPMGKIKDYDAKINIDTPVQYVTKYTQNLANKAGNIKMMRRK